MSGANNVPAYNPADYGPSTGPTLPREEPAETIHFHQPQYGEPHYDPVEHGDQYRHRAGPENVSAPHAYEHSAEPGMSRSS